MGRRRRRARGDHGAVLVEFALTAPLMLALVFAIIDFGTIYFEQLTLRNDTQASARLAAVANFGTDSTCATQGGAWSGNSLRLLCQTKNAIQINDKHNIRVKIALPDSTGFAKGNRLLLCTQYAASSVTGAYGPVLNGKVLTSKSTIRIETAGTLAPAEENSPAGGDWSFCS
jgi:uncharacterized membrane protein